jgi:hypothetical protein
MFDINPQGHRYYLEDTERQMKPQMRDSRDNSGYGSVLGRLRGAPAVLALAAFLLGGFAGGTLF